MKYTTVPDSTNFIKFTFAVSLGVDFETYLDIINYTAASEAFDKNNTGNPQLHEIMQQMLAETPGNDNAVPVFYSKNKCRDSSLGGNDAINCYYQFNENDDVTHPFIKTDHGLDGMGRVYSEHIDDNQQVMYITFGRPIFNDVSSFYNNAIDPLLSAIMNSGDRMSEIGTFLGNTITTFILLPTMPLAFLYDLAQSTSRVQITKYYEFDSAMPLYYRCVNAMLAHLAVNMNLANDSYLLNSTQQASGTPSTTDQTADEAAKNTNNAQTTPTGLPAIFQRFGFDIYRILQHKDQYLNNSQNNDGSRSTDQAIADLAGDTTTVDTTTSDSTSYFGKSFITQFKNAIYEADYFIGFRVERTTDSGESLSNQTGESSIAQTLNSKIEQVRDFKFSAMGGNTGTVIDGIIKGLTGFANGVSKAFGVGGLEEVIKGSGIIDIPEVWKNSTFTKHYSFHMKLRSPYGDPISIMQSIYVPLAMILGGALPRAVGASSYTAPFICRAYCKGMFSVPLGIIDSVDITRGSPQYGWSSSRLPTSVDVSFTIKDLSPAMYVAMSNGSITNAITEVFGANSSFQEYLLTLSGVGLYERISIKRGIRRRMQYLIQIARETKLNPAYWGMGFGNSPPGRLLSALTPLSRLPNN